MATTSSEGQKKPSRGSRDMEASKLAGAIGREGVILGIENEPEVDS